MRRWRWIRRFAFGLGLLGLALGLLGNAEIRVPQLRGPLQTGLAALSPGLEVDPAEVFARVIPWRGTMRVRLGDTRLAYPQGLRAPITVKSLSFDVPLARALARDFLPTQVRVRGAEIELSVPEQWAAAFPDPGQAQDFTAQADLFFRTDWLADLAALVPPHVLRYGLIEDVTITLLDPRGQSDFLTFRIDQAQKWGRAVGDGAHRRMTLDGHLRSPTAQETELTVMLALEGAEQLRLDVATGALVPAHYYEALRFWGLSTPERLLTGYKAHTALTLTSRQGFQSARFDLTEVREGRDHLIAVAEALINSSQEVLEVSGEFADLTIQRLAPWTPVPDFLQGISLTTAGSAAFRWDHKTGEWLGEFALRSGQGVLQIAPLGLPSQPDAAVGVRHVQGKGAFNASGLTLSDVRLETGNAEVIGPIVEASLTARVSDLGTLITVDATSAALNRGDLMFLWPTALAVGARKRVETAFQAGALRDLAFTGIYTLEHHAQGRAKLSIEGQQVSAGFNQGQVMIRPELPRIEQAVGQLTLANRQLEISVDSAQMGRVALGPARTNLDFSKPDWLEISVQSPVSGPIAPALADLAAGKIGLDGLANLPLDRLQGTAQGDVDLQLAFDPRAGRQGGIGLDNLDLHATLRAQDLQIANFLLGQGIESGTLDLIITDQKLTGQGPITLDGLAGTVEIEQTFARPDTPGALIVQAVGTVPVVKAQSFVPGLGGLAEGAAPAQVTFTRHSPGARTLAMQLDLAPVALALPALNYQKPSGTAGRLGLTLDLDEDGVLGVRDLTLSAPDLEVAGSIDLGAGNWSGARLTRVQFGETDLRDLRLANRSDQLWASVGGGQLDLEPLIERFTDQAQGGQRGFGLTLERPLVLESAYFDTLRFKPGSTLRDARASLVIGDKGIRGLTLNALVPSNESGVTGGRTDLRVVRREGGYGLSLNADNFGALMKALGMSGDVRGGRFAMSGNSRHPLGAGPWILEGTGEEIRLQQVPALVEVVAAISLTGILEQMGGTGLFVSDLHFKGRIDAPQLAVERLRIVGPSLGLNMAGRLNWASGRMAFRGALAPFNVVNMFLSEIPVIRELFTGADGEGVFAAQFEIGGTARSPQVQVDPLSLIQPGIMRSFIDEIEEEVRESRSN